MLCALIQCVLHGPGLSPVNRVGDDLVKYIPGLYQRDPFWVIEAIQFNARYTMDHWPANVIPIQVNSVRLDRDPKI